MMFKWLISLICCTEIGSQCTELCRRLYMFNPLSTNIFCRALIVLLFTKFTANSPNLVLNHMKISFGYSVLQQLMGFMLLKLNLNSISLIQTSTQQTRKTAFIAIFCFFQQSANYLTQFYQTILLLIILGPYQHFVYSSLQAIFIFRSQSFNFMSAAIMNFDVFCCSAKPNTKFLKSGDWHYK